MYNMHHQTYTYSIWNQCLPHHVQNYCICAGLIIAFVIIRYEPQTVKPIEMINLQTLLCQTILVIKKTKHSTQCSFTTHIGTRKAHIIRSIYSIYLTLIYKHFPYIFLIIFVSIEIKQHQTFYSQTCMLFKWAFSMSYYRAIKAATL